jgi:AmmeMemoRadiSam system protein B
MLRDTQGVASTHAVLPLELVPIVARFTGAKTCEAIAREASVELKQDVPVDLVVKLATELEDSLFVDGAPYRAARARIEREFADADVRPASHAGGAYYGDQRSLAQYIDRECFAAANGHAGGPGRLSALIAPHIDPWRGARCYGEAYGVFGKAVPDDVDTFILFGTSHAPMREPFALCRKAFETPFGRMPAHTAAIDRIAAACEFDPYADQFNHKKEHSLEFQVVFLQHLLRGRKAKIIPVLAGLGNEQSTGASPKTNGAVERFFDAVRGVVEDEKAFLIAGADLAHMGPRFGDPKPLDEAARTRLDSTDRESIGLATHLEAEPFWEQVAADLDSRRVCGLAPIYSLLRTVTPKAKGRLGWYEQTIDPEEGSIVSHAAVGFYV